jgi:hypothetical protein
MILLPVKPENPAEPEKPVHQLQITTSTTNPKASKFHTKLHHCGNEGKSAASSCPQVAAWVTDMFSHFYLVENHNIAQVSRTITEKYKHIFAILRILENF